MCPCQYGVSDENEEIPKMLVITESGHQIDEIDEIDENTLKLAVRGAPPNWSSRASVWQRIEMLWPTASFPKFLLRVLRAEGGHWCDLRKRHHIRAEKTFGGTHVYKGMV